MELQHISVAVRSRSPWEAADLGIALARREWRTAVGGTLLVAAPLFLIAQALVAVHPWAGLALLWWIEPVLERVPLEVMSRRFFGDVGSAGSFVRQHHWPGVGELAALLTVRRLSPARAYTASVAQLEGLRGAARHRRVEVLTRAHLGHAWWVTTFALLAECALWLSVYALASMIVPEELGVDVAPPLEASASVGAMWVANAVALAAIVVVMPFHVGMGFSLYIARRVELEGWDVELSFRRLAGRLSRTEPARAAAAGAR